MSEQYDARDRPINGGSPGGAIRLSDPVSIQRAIKDIEERLPFLRENGLDYLAKQDLNRISHYKQYLANAS